MALPAPSTGGTALVTGASSGIGAAIARGAGRRGPRAHPGRAPRGAPAEPRDRARARSTGARPSVIACDLGRPRRARAARRGGEERGRAVEVLVNNAGFGSRGEFASNDPEPAWSEMVRAQRRGGRRPDRPLPAGDGRARARRDHQHRLDLRAFQPLPGAATYAASKAFVLSFSEAIRTELRGSGVTVTAVCPGPVKTEFAEAAGMSGVEDSTPDADLDVGRGHRARRPSRAPSATSGSSCRARSTGRVAARPAHAALHRRCRSSGASGARPRRGARSSADAGAGGPRRRAGVEQRGEGPPVAAGPRDRASPRSGTPVAGRSPSTACERSPTTAAGGARRARPTATPAPRSRSRARTRRS